MKKKYDELVSKLKFSPEGLIPAIVQDYRTGDVLMLAYMNKESLKITMEKNLTCFYSRSRKKLWTKGESSGAYQHVVSISEDCDSDTLLVKVKKDGPACHSGSTTCFDDRVVYRASDEEGSFFTLETLMDVIKDRKVNRKEGSYTTYLFDKGLDKILKKVGEECTEVIIAAKAQDKKETIYEISDLVYHVLVLMLESGISILDISSELASRHVIDKKVKQEKMT